MELTAEQQREFKTTAEAKVKRKFAFVFGLRTVCALLFACFGLYLATLPITGFENGDPFIAVLVNNGKILFCMLVGGMAGVLIEKVVVRLSLVKLLRERGMISGISTKR